MSAAERAEQATRQAQLRELSERAAQAEALEQALAAERAETMIDIAALRPDGAELRAIRGGVCI